MTIGECDFVVLTADSPDALSADREMDSSATVLEV
jgi:hypothetical protein